MSNDKFDKSLYNEEYYNTSFGGIPYNRDSYNGHWIKFFSNISKQIENNYKPIRVLDVGCAKGFVVEGLRDLGVNAYGFDISETAIAEVRQDIQPYCRTGAIDDASMYDGAYDLITCIEVLEHVPAVMAEAAIKLMCEHTSQIVFSSSPSDFDEPTHINVQSPAYWDELFAKYGFIRGGEVWPSEHIAPHALLYRKSSEQRIRELSNRQDDFRIENKSQFKEVVTQMKSLSNEFNKSFDSTKELFFTQLKEINEYLAKMNGEKVRLTALLDENIKLKTQINELHMLNESNRDLIQNSQNQLVDLNKNEQSLRNHIHSLNIQIAQLNDQLQRIQTGKTFRVLKKYWKLRDNILPLHSRRREFVKAIVKRRKFNKISLKQQIQESPQSAVVETNLWNEGNLRWLESSQYPSYDELSHQKLESGNFDLKPLISILLPVYKIKQSIFKETVDSVINQSYENWELCVAVADLEDLELVQYIKNVEVTNDRIKCVYLEENGGISKNTNQALNLASGDFIALLDHDDIITPDALYQMVKTINEYPEVDFLYSDKDQINENGSVRLNPLFKHKWSWATMLSANYPTHFCLIRRNIFSSIGLFDPTTDGAQDWDIFLRVSEQANRIIHVPKVLYHWRIIETSVASGLQAKPYVVEAQNRALANYVYRNQLNGTLVRNEDHTFRMVWNKSSISYDVLIYTDKATRLKDIFATLESIKAQLVKPSRVIILQEQKMDAHFDAYGDNFEICIQSGSYIEAFNSFKNAQVLILKAGILLTTSEVASELAAWLKEGNYAAASGMILDSNDLVLNAGYVFSDRNEIIEPFKGMPTHAYTTYGSVNWYRDYRAVSVFALMINKENFASIIENIGFEKTMEELLLESQILVSKENTILYDPYLRIKFNGTTVENKWLLADSVNDLYFNGNVWDWNPSYMKSKFIPKVSSEKKADNSIWSGYTSDAMILSTLYDFTKEDLEKNQQIILQSENIGTLETATWFLPPFSTAFYGGIHTILRFAEFLTLNRKIRNQFVIVGIDDVRSVREAILAAFPSLEDCEVIGLTSDYRINSIPSSDISFCTLWTTAYTQLKYNKTKKKFYFLQDWEPLFYPGGSTSAQVEATYGFGYTAICNTISLKLSYEELGGKAFHFTPCVDTSVFYPPQYERAEEPYLVFLYGRPGNPRNCFELAIPALKKVKNYFGDKVRIVSAGADWDAAAYGADGVIEHLGMLPYKSTGDLYRQCHVGLAMMMTRHPSYLPFELMASGCLVVANKNPWNTWMLQDGVNCKVAEASVSCIAEAIIDALLNLDERKRLTSQATKLIINERSDWNKEFQKLLSEVFQRN
ncbi:glycosyltransferase [Paenibacillus whitsoniae]|uniref:Glycosyltransferase n=1 Tax=Paenibacillus whitsoniae TaxID=2496558 RepID=A0A430JAU7_9BACL|nr:glycosyltransferase [Paenibacillus whitsoniae]RTE08163.1 glycosyltransferase [Paenibacillus whitsoniae]